MRRLKASDICQDGHYYKRDGTRCFMGWLYNEFGINNSITICQIVERAIELTGTTGGYLPTWNDSVPAQEVADLWNLIADEREAEGLSSS